jgi:hypothetical protein
MRPAMKSIRKALDPSRQLEIFSSEDKAYIPSFVFTSQTAGLQYYGGPSVHG